MDQQFGEQVLVEGGVFLPADNVVMLAQLLTLVFYGGLFLVFLGGPLFKAIGFTKGQDVCKLLTDNQMSTVAMLFFCNMAAGQLLSSGAFEVYYNGQLMHSKLETGALPDIPNLIKMGRMTLSNAA